MLLSFIIVVIVVMAGLNVYSLYITRSMESQYSKMISGMMTIHEISRDIDSSSFYLDKYFSAKTQSDLYNYRRYYQDAMEKVQVLKDSLDEENLIILQELKSTIESYNEESENSMFKLLSSKSNDDFYYSLLETRKIAAYIDEHAIRLSDGYLKYNNNLYKQLKAQNELNNKAIPGLLILIMVSCIIFSVVLSEKITGPLNELVEKSQKVSKGDFNIEEIKISSIYEIGTFASGFNDMVKDIKRLIQTIKEKANVEKKLKDEELKNLLTQNMLKESKLKALQSQINPHFLFNTLNAVVQTAVIEGAYETEKLMNSVSDLLRYSLNMIESQSTLGDEIESIKQYIYIQETRFKDRVKFKVEVQNGLSNVEIPGMTLQPLVENAFIHGIESKEEGGEIHIEAWEEEGFCIVKIEDNGVGMSQEKIEEIMVSEDMEHHKGHTTGIGVGNVIKRIRLLYEIEDGFKIESEKGKGTKIYIKIPKYSEVGGVAEC